MASSSVPSTCSRILQSHAGAVNVIKLDKSGEYCLSGGSDKLVKLWSTFGRYSHPIQAYSGHSWDIVDLCMYKTSADNKTFASVGGDRTCFYWDVTTGRIIRRFSGHLQRLTAVDMNDLGTVIASGSVDKTVRLWDAKANSRLPIQILEDAKDTIGSIRIRDAEIFVGSLDGTVRIYDLRNGKMIEDSLGDAVTCLSVSEDGKLFLAACHDESLKLVDRLKGTVLNTFKGHKNKEYSGSCLIIGSSHVIGGSEDGSIYAWDLISAKVIRTLTGHKNVISSLACTGSSVLSASFDGTIRIWS